MSNFKESLVIRSVANDLLSKLAAKEALKKITVEQAIMALQMCLTEVENCGNLAEAYEHNSKMCDFTQSFSE